MQKVDRLGWAAGWSFQGYGVRLGVRSNDPAALDLIRPFLAPGVEQTDDPVVDHLLSLRVGPAQRARTIRAYNFVYLNHMTVTRTLNLQEALLALENEMDLIVAEHSQEYIFVHAGVVGHAGRALLVPGRTRTGKSTLIAALVRAGASYYSDEFALLDPTGRVHPFPRRLQMRNEAGESSIRMTPEDLGGSYGCAPLPVGMVAICPFKGVKRFRLRTMTPGHAILTLMKNCIPVRRRPADTMAVLHRALQSAALLQGSRAEADAAARVLLSRLEQSAAAS